MEAQSAQMQVSIETMFFSVRELLIYGTGYRLLWWRLPPLTLLRRDWLIGMMWNHKLLLMYVLLCFFSWYNKFIHSFCLQLHPQLLQVTSYKLKPRTADKMCERQSEFLACLYGALTALFQIYIIRLS